MTTLVDIEKAVNALPLTQQKELLLHLAQRLQAGEKPKGSLPIVPSTGRPITQAEIDDALDSE